MVRKKFVWLGLVLWTIGAIIALIAHPEAEHSGIAMLLFMLLGGVTGIIQFFVPVPKNGWWYVPKAILGMIGCMPLGMAYVEINEIINLLMRT